MFKKLMLTAALVVAVTGQAIFAADFTKMVPEGTDFILQINVSKILAMPELKKQIDEGFTKQPEQKKMYEELKAKSGFDPLTDIKSVILFSSGKMEEGKEPLGGALIEGKFDIDKIVKVIKDDENAKKDVDVTLVDGFNCVVPKNSKEGYGMFLDSQYVVVGSQIGVNAVKDVKMGKGKTIATQKALVDIIGKVNSNATICGAGLLPKAFKDKCAQNPNAAALANIDTFFFDFNNDSNLVLNFNATVDNEKNVNTVLTQINGYIAMVKMFAGQAPEIAEAINMLSATNEGTTIKLNLNIPAAKVAEIKAKLEERAKKLQQGGNDANAPRE
jgi:uncharacterized protein YdbL (DUF1318 family)